MDRLSTLATSKVIKPDEMTAAADPRVTIRTLRFREAEITVIKVMLIQANINTTSSRVSSAVTKTDTTAAINMELTTTFHPTSSSIFFS